MGEEFSIDSILDFFNVGDEIREREYFESRFTFPMECKKETLKYLRKHKKEIVDEIVEKAKECED